MLVAVALTPLTGCEPPMRQSAPNDPFGIATASTKRAKPKIPTLLGVPMSSSEPQVSLASGEPEQRDIPAGAVAPTVAEPEVDEGETPSASCPEGMVLVHGNACTEARQTCLSWLDTDSGEVPKRCANFSTNVVCTGERKPMTFCIDRWEYTKAAGEVPVANVSWTVSKDMCRSMGKRLCTESEWVFACEGEDMLPYPTGYSREPNKCHFDQMDLVDKKGKMRDLRRPGTEMPACASPFGVMNMIGNVDEWTEREKAWTPWRASLKGGWWLAGRNRCRPATTGHDEYFFEVQTGFRCCKDAAAAPLPRAFT